jgi:hypothetical protein
MVDDVEQLRGEVRAVIRVEPWAVRAVSDRFGRQAQVTDGDATLIEVRAHRLDALAEQLAGWTDVVEVLELSALARRAARTRRADRPALPRRLSGRCPRKRSGVESGRLGWFVSRFGVCAGNRGPEMPVLRERRSLELRSMKGKQWHRRRR